MPRSMCFLHTVSDGTVFKVIVDQEPESTFVRAWINEGPEQGAGFGCALSAVTGELRTEIDRRLASKPE